jgi:hypothetical protein
VHGDAELAQLFRIHVAARAGAEKNDMLKSGAAFGDIGRQVAVIDDGDLGAAQHIWQRLRVDIRVEVNTHRWVTRLLQALENHARIRIAIHKHCPHSTCSIDAPHTTRPAPTLARIGAIGEIVIWPIAERPG